MNKLINVSVQDSVHFFDIDPATLLQTGVYASKCSNFVVHTFMHPEQF